MDRALVFDRMDDLTSIDDDALLARTRRAVERANQNTEALLRLLDEIDSRRLFLERGYPSMFALCVERFHMSEAVAHKRIGAARLARRFPVIFEMIGRGEIHLSGVLALRAVLTEANHLAVLGRAKHRTRREIEKLVAELAPKADVPSRVRALPRKKEARTSAAPTPEAAAPLALSAPGAAAKSPAPLRAPDPQPLAPRRYKLEVTIDEETHDKLRQLQGLLAHQLPNGDPAIIVARALDSLLDRTLKRKAALTDAPREVPDEVDHDKRHIPAAIRRAVWKRDGGRCAFVSKDGRRCTETRCLEFAHTEPWARGGEHRVETIGLRCRAHNDFEAVRDYGEDFMAGKRPDPRIREEAAPYRSPRGESGWSVVVRRLDTDPRPTRPGASWKGLARSARGPGSHPHSQVEPSAATPSYSQT